MSFVAGSITGQIGLDAAPQVKAIKTAVAGAKEYREAMANAANEGASAFKHAAEKNESAAKEMADKIKQSLGKRSALGEWTELLAGGGAVMGLALVAKEATEAVKKLGELNQQMAEGKANSFDMAEGVAKMIPVFGQFYEMGREIRNVLTGENQELAEMKSYVDEQNASLAERNRIIKEGAAAEKEFADQILVLDQKLALLNADGKNARDMLENQQAAGDARQKAKDLYTTKAIDPLNAKQKEYDDLDKQLAQKQAELASIVANHDPNDEAHADEEPEYKAAQKEIDELTAKRSNAAVELQAARANEKKLRQQYADDLNHIDAISAANQKEINARSLKDMQDQQKKMQEEWDKAREHLAQPIINAKTATDQMGMTESQKIIDNLNRARAASPNIVSDKELSDAKKVLEDYDEAVKNKALDEKVKSFREGVETPQKKLQKTMDELRDWLATGKITTREYDTGVAKARKEAFGDIDAHRPSLIRTGSAESLAAQYAGGRQETLAGIAQKTLTAHEKTNELLGTLISGQQNEVPDTIADSQDVA